MYAPFAVMGTRWNMSERESARSGGTGFSPRNSVAARVVGVAVLSAALGGLLAALMAIVAVDQLIAMHADQRLRAALDTLADELNEEDTDEELRNDLPSTLEDENDEIQTSGIRLSVFEGMTHLAGIPPIEPPALGACETMGSLGTRVRSCSRSYANLTLVSQQRRDQLLLLWYYALALTLATVLGGVFGALLSKTLTRWALGPLSDVAARLRVFEPGRLDTIQLGPPSQLQEVKAVQEAVRLLTDNVQKLLGQAQSFAANAAHELRTPLTTIRAELELLSEQATGAEDKHALERTNVHVQRLAVLVERLLVLALPPAQLNEAFEAVSLSDVAQDVLQRSWVAEQARLRLRAESEGVVRGDATLLESMVTKAVENALSYTDGSVDVAVRQEANDVIVEIVDRGPGMSQEESVRAFEPFYRANAHTKQQGFGLGLALISHVAQVHGGRVDLHSDKSGTRIAIRLPGWRTKEFLDSNERAPLETAVNP